jgi:hypothetical protein
LYSADGSRSPLLQFFDQINGNQFEASKEVFLGSTFGLGVSLAHIGVGCVALVRRESESIMHSD